MGFWEKVGKFMDSLETDDRDSFNENYTEYKGQNEERQWCPLCGYSGTADNLRCHLLNNHR